MTTFRLRVAPALGAGLSLLLIAMGTWTPRARWLLIGIGVALLVVIGLGLAFMAWKPPSQAPPGGRHGGMMGIGMAFLVGGIAAVVSGTGASGGAFLPPAVTGVLLLVCSFSLIGFGIRQRRRQRPRGENN